MKGYKQVTKDEFYKFAEDHYEKTGVKLERDVAAICEPPLMTLNDFSDGKVWPQSIVAKALLMDGSDYYDGRKTEYYLKNS